MRETEKGKFTPLQKVEVTEVHENLSQQVIQITVDRITLILYKYASDIGKRRDWIAPAGILITILLAVATTTFKDWYLSKETWSAFFIIIGIITSVWLVVSLIKVRKGCSIEDLVDRIKKT